MKTYLTPVRADSTCTACRTLFENLPVESDDAGAYVEIPTEPCHDDECTTHLCSCCPQFMCACCGLKFCMEHLGREEDPECMCILAGDQADARCCDAHGTRNPRPVLLCRVCAAPEEVEARIEPVTECGPITDAA
jgi:hypothetical protein